ncbi:MAG: hypothetical protein Q8M11_05420 [Sulfuritalea sp.]|nr:hypothetical protein [Sulfuritalea sp.]
MRRLKIQQTIALVQRVAGFAHHRFERSGMPSQPLDDIVKAVMGLLHEMARELKTTRHVLEPSVSTSPFCDSLRRAGRSI